MERPLERRASVRTAVVWETLRSLLEGRQPSTVLDIGGGTGGIAVRMAELGHHVTVVDPNPDALAALGRRAAERGVADRISGVQGDLASVGALVPAGAADLLLCHEVLGLVPDAGRGLIALRDLLAPDGTLSLVVNQRHAAVLARAVAGQFTAARVLLEEAGQVVGLLDRGAERRFVAAELVELVESCGMVVREVQGVRVFADLVPSALLDLEPGAVAGLLELERAASTRPEYHALASQLHLLAAL